MIEAIVDGDKTDMGSVHKQLSPSDEERNASP